MRLGLTKFDVISAANGPDALALIRRVEPVAVILDMRMPGGGGMTALDAIKSDPVTSNLPVMMLTGERDPDTVMTAMGAGASDYMVKPFNPDRLLERVNRLVKSSAMIWGKPAAANDGPTWEL